MWSAAIPKPAENLHSDDTTPHNAPLRIIGPAHEDSVARSLVVGGVGFRDDADAFGLQTEGDDLALEIVADLLERTDGSHVTSPVCVSSPRPPRPRWRSSGRGRSATHPPSGPQRSGGRRRRDFLASRGMGVAQGKKVSSDGVAAQTIEAQPIFGQIEPSKRPRASRAEPQVREKMAGLGSVRQEVETVRRRKRNEGKQKAVSSAQSQSRPNGSSRHIYVHWTQSTPSHRSAPRKVATISRSSAWTRVRCAALADKFDR